MSARKERKTWERESHKLNSVTIHRKQNKQKHEAQHK